MPRFGFVALLATLLSACSSAPPDPLRPGQNWMMRDQATGFITQFETIAMPVGVTMGCYASTRDEPLEDFYIAKTDASAYWDPYDAWNVHLILKKFKRVGWAIVGQYVVDMRDPGTTLYTIYFHTQDGQTPADALLGQPGTSYSSWNLKFGDVGRTNTCHPLADFLGANPHGDVCVGSTNTPWCPWTSTWVMRVDGALVADYCEMAGYVDPGCWYEELWTFDAHGLVELHATRARGVVVNQDLVRMQE